MRMRREYFIVKLQPGPRSSLHEMRVVKSPGEISLMRESCRLGAEAIR